MRGVVCRVASRSLSNHGLPLRLLLVDRAGGRRLGQLGKLGRVVMERASGSRHRCAAGATAAGGPSRAQGKRGTPLANRQLLNYLTNHPQRMKYGEYLRQGMPITSNYVDSTQTNQSPHERDGEVLVGLRRSHARLGGRRLSETIAIRRFWSERTRRIIQTACYHQAP